MRFPLAVVIVLIHVTTIQAVVVNGVEHSFVDNMPSVAFFVNFIGAFFRGQSVPIYFFISGYVFFLSVTGGYTKNIYLNKIKNRIKTLFIPYIVWNVLSALFLMSFYIPPLSSLGGKDISDLNLSWQAVLNTFWDFNNGILGNGSGTFNWPVSPQNEPLWFLRDLMVLTLISPIIYLLVRKLGVYIVMLFGVVWFYGSIFNSGIASAFVGLFFFSLGAYFSINKMDMVHQFGKYSKLSFCIYPLLGAICLGMSYLHLPSEIMSIVKTTNIFVGLFFAYNLAALIIEKGIFRSSAFLSSSSFFIYVSHGLIMGFLKFFYILIKPVSGLGIIGVYLLATLVIIMLLLGIYWLMRRFTPRLLGVLVGRRA